MPITVKAASHYLTRLQLHSLGFRGMVPIQLLRWSLSLVLGIPAVALIMSSPPVPLIAIGISEAVGALLLLPRRTRLYGGGLLVLSLLAASGFHALSGELPPAAFLVYVAAIAVVAKPC
jgi:hypothetical protein